MQRAQIRRLPVVNRDKRLVGIVALGDLAVQTGDEELSGEVLEEVSEPAEPRR
jgi:CBS domain-containing protein